MQPNIDAIYKVVKSKNIEFLVSPNLVERNQTFNMICESKTREIAQMSILDMTGKVVYSLPLDLKEGQNQFSINAPTVSGMYYVKLLGQEGSVYTQKIVVQ